MGRDLLLVAGFVLLTFGSAGLLQGIEVKDLEDAIFGGILIAGSALFFAFVSKTPTLEKQR